MEDGDERHFEDDVKSISFGPVVNPDGTPTEFTQGMFGFVPRELSKVQLRDKLKKIKKARGLLYEAADGLPTIMSGDLLDAASTAFDIQEAVEEMIHGSQR